MIRRFVVLVTLLLPLVAMADTAVPVAEDPVLEQRLMVLSAELRCLVCQNQSLADSHADLAIDLKNQVRAMLKEGKSDAEIKAYMTDRYGDFVLYRPPVKGTTWLLWAGPFVLLVAGLAALAWMVLRRRAAERGATATQPSEADLERARALLAASDPPSCGD
ncbi:MAG: cytochrome c-type biogenesis protein CcmH [Burkholderiales bacterium]|nr:cytochrome c-type biogenesis protein CcmH [Burkholderiales bacterium]